MNLLREAIAAGFHDVPQLRDEPLLAQLRPSAEFQSLMSMGGNPGKSPNKQ